MVKVWCSEMLDYVVDETVQIFGGAGYVEDYPAERYWRDARVNRIFEGTNEINRLLVPGRLIRRAMKGELPVFQKAMALMEEVTAGPPPREATEGFLAAEARMVAGRQEGRAHVPGPRGAEVRRRSWTQQQEVLGLFADVAMETYALESARAAHAEARGRAQGEDKRAAAGGGRALLRPGRARPHRDLGAPAAGRRRRRRHAAHLPGGAQALHQARGARTPWPCAAQVAAAVVDKGGVSAV